MAFASLGACAALLGCSVTPGSGPTGYELTEASTGTDPKFALIEVNQSLVDLMSGWPDASLFGRFGDHRAPANQRIGVGDSVQITLWEAAAGGLFSTPVTGPGSPGSRTAVIPPQTVNEDGAITIPYAGRVPLAGKTAPQVERVIVDRLAGKAIEPQAVLTVTQNVSNTVTVMGEVNTAGRISLSSKGDRVLDVLASAGGIRAPVQESVIALTRRGVTQNVPMQALLTQPRENIYVLPGDNITVARQPESFTAVGATGTNAVVSFDFVGISLEEAVAKAGGLIDARADPAAVYVMRYEPTKLAERIPGVAPELLKSAWTPVVYHVDMREPDALLVSRRFAMRDKDILYVSNAPLAELQKLTVLFQTVNEPLTTSFLIRRL